MKESGNFDPFVDAVETSQGLSIIQLIRDDYRDGKISLIQLLSGTVRESLALEVLQDALSNGVDVASLVAKIQREGCTDNQALELIRKSLVGEISPKSDF